MITRVELIDLVMPNDCNHYRNAFGGWVMGRIDIAAAVLAKKIAHGPIVTAKVSEINFSRPIPQGSTMKTIAYLQKTGNTSMEIMVKIYIEEDTGGDLFCTEAYVTMVAVDKDGKPKPLNEEKRNWVVERKGDWDNV
jgi:acyl-CoA thioesterase YciA